MTNISGATDRQSASFPVLPSAALREIPNAAAEKLPLHVLVVDDEPLIRWSVTATLTALGVAVEEAADAASALRAITAATQPFDVIVLDLHLPDVRDLSLLASVRQLRPAARILLMTAHHTPEIVAQALELGAQGTLGKPFELAELSRRVLSEGAVTI